MAHSLDQHPLDAPAGTLRELLAAARQQLSGNRLVVEVRAEGRALSADEIEARMLRPLDDEALELISADPQALATSALDDALDRLALLGRQQAEAADELQADHAGGAFSLLGDALAGWMQVSNAVSHSCELTGVDLASLSAGAGDGGATGTGAAEELAERLREIRTQIESQDTIALADSLAYVWPEVVERWQALVEDLQRRLNEASAADGG